MQHKIYTDEEKPIRNHLFEEVELLHKWNENNIRVNPEQYRKNLETILRVANFLFFNTYI